MIHHTEDTQIALDEIYRVLMPEGAAAMMIYHKYSIVGFMLWMRYGLGVLKPWRIATYIHHNYLESPGNRVC